VVRAVFKDGEVSEISVTFAPDLHGASITLSLTAEGERFSDLVIQVDVEGGSVGDWRERLRSDMADSLPRVGSGGDRTGACDGVQGHVRNELICR
jgi:hypothetical protein